MEMSYTIARNAAAWMLAAIAHALVLYLLAIGLRSRYAVEPTNEWRGEFISIKPNRSPVTAETRKPSSARRDSFNDDNSNEPFERGAATESIQDPIDWNSAATGAISDAVREQQSQDAHRSLDSKPQMLELPKGKAGTRHQRGDTQRFDGGEINTWISPECYATNHPDGPPSKDANQVHVICKGNAGRRKANGDLFDSVRPNYLGGPRTDEGKQGRKSRDGCVTSCSP